MLHLQFHCQHLINEYCSSEIKFTGKLKHSPADVLADAGRVENFVIPIYSKSRLYG